MSGTAYGVDGCRAGWFYFALARSEEPAWGIVEAIEELVSSVDDSDHMFVDIPIGLPDGPEARLCDREARGRLGGPRASSVFPGAGARGAGSGDIRGRESNQPESKLERG